MSQSLAATSESDHELGDAGASSFPRVRSDGEFDISNPQRHPQEPNPTLQTIPSFSVYNSRAVEGEGEEGVGGGDGLERTITIGENIVSAGDDFSFSDGKGVSLAEGIGRIEEDDENPNGTLDEGMETMPLFLARGLGIDISSAATEGTGNGAVTVPTEDLSGSLSGLENYYKKILEEYPCHPLYLRNYAQFLYQSKGDLERAEEYYSRAILAEPGDGEILSQYAKLIWERHHDFERASTYFEQAAQAAPHDSDVLAAHASFLWETEDAEQGEEDESDTSQGFAAVAISHGTMAPANAA